MFGSKIGILKIILFLKNRSIFKFNIELNDHSISNRMNVAFACYDLSMVETEKEHVLLAEHPFSENSDWYLLISTLFFLSHCTFNIERNSHTLNFLNYSKMIRHCIMCSRIERRCKNVKVVNLKYVVSLFYRSVQWDN